MSSVEGRFTAHFTPAERDALRAAAREQGTSENYLVRVGLRAVLGLPVPRWARDELERTLERVAA